MENSFDFLSGFLAFRPSLRQPARPNKQSPKIDKRDKHLW